MDGVFMRKYLKRILLICLLVFGVYLYTAVTDMKSLQEQLIRLHVVARSDSQEDQNVKLQVRDAILEEISEGMEDAADMEAAGEYLQEILPKLEEKANLVLENGGFSQRVSISFDFENFPQRIYDTFSLPSGIYRSLRVIIGEGEGANWWCVVFPQLCAAESLDDFAVSAVDAGLSERVTKTISGEKGSKVRFLTLELLGKLENLLWERH